MKVICGLGNPGAEYATTRHNVGWWLLEHLRVAWAFPAFGRKGLARFSDGERAGHRVVLVQPLTYMNRSGSALAPLVSLEDFAVPRDLLVVVDDVNLDVGRTRLRPGGSPGGHNGLSSVEEALGTQEYARLRIGVGSPPPGDDLVAWVLSPMVREDEDVVRALFPSLAECTESWLVAGPDLAMQRCNR